VELQIIQISTAFCLSLSLGSFIFRILSQAKFNIFSPAHTKGQAILKVYTHTHTHTHIYKTKVGVCVAVCGGHISSRNKYRSFNVVRMGIGEVHTGFWWGKLRARSTRRPRHRWEDNIKINFQEI
jgi:hypothetical protein